VPNPPLAVRELARVLRPGGRLFLTTPNYIGTMGLYRGYLRLRGRPFSEIGQPINQFTMLPRTIRWMNRAGLAVLATDAIGHYLPFPRRPPIRLTWLDAPRPLMQWLALHSFVLARKPA
jgi:SAM-dependent methyltransferase